MPPFLEERGEGSTLSTGRLRVFRPVGYLVFSIILVPIVPVLIILVPIVPFLVGLVPFVPLPIVLVPVPVVPVCSSSNFFRIEMMENFLYYLFQGGGGTSPTGRHTLCRFGAQPAFSWRGELWLMVMYFIHVQITTHSAKVERMESLPKYALHTKYMQPWRGLKAKI